MASSAGCTTMAEVDGTSAEESQEKKQDSEQSLAPDGGWGWVVVVGSFFSYMIADGCLYSFGVLYPHFLRHFNQSKGKTAVIGALLHGVPRFFCPLLCAMSSKYGCRVVAVTGGTITGVALVVSSQATSVEYLCVTLGILVSIGLQMTYISAIVIVTFYFEKRRGLATGLSVMGSGVGAFTAPPLVGYLVQEFSWRGALLLLGGIAFHIVVAGGLFRPLDTENNEEEWQDLPHRYIDDKNNPLSLEDSGNALLYPTVHHKCVESLKHEKDHHGLLNAKSVLVRYHSSLSLIYSSRFSNSTRSIDGQPSLFKSLENMASPDHRSQEICRLNQHECHTSFPDVCTSKEIVNPTRDTEMDSGKDRKQPCRWQRKLSSFVDSMFDKAVLQEKTFVLFCLASFLLYTWLSVPSIYLLDKVSHMAIPENKATLLLSVMGISRTLGQGILGYLGDHPKLSAVTLYGAGIVICGGATLFIPLYKTYAAFMMSCILYGFATSVTYCLQMMSMVNIIGLERATGAFGLLQLVQGVAVLVGTPVAGLLYDKTGNYDASFYTAGIWITVAGTLLIIIPAMKKKTASRLGCGQQ